MYPRLTRAPIAEVLIDIRVETGSFSLERIGRFSAAIHEDFPDVQDINISHHTFDLGRNESRSSQPVLTGKIHWNSQRTLAVQATTPSPNGSGGLTINWTQQYSHFSDLERLANEIWPKFRAALEPGRIVRTALRYINKLDIESNNTVGHILKTAPSIGGGVPPEFHDFFLRAAIPKGDFRTLVVTESFNQVPDKEEWLLILDIDAFSERVFGPEDDSLWSELRVLRGIKNEVFFSSFTESFMEGLK